jgi:hypothetical protein
MDNWTKIQANITKGVKEITDLFTSTGPDLPETDMEMCLEADRAYAEGARRNRLRSRGPRRCFPRGA